MLGQIDPTQKEVTIIGGGISGLLMAYALDKKGFEVTLFEAAPQSGGVIRTVETPFGIAESAAHSLLASFAVQKLCEELQVSLTPVDQQSKARYVLRRGKLRRFPLGFFEALRAFFRAYFVLADRSIPSGQMTLDDWCRRHLGNAALDYLLSPMVRVIYGASPDRLWVSASFPVLSIPHGHSLLSYLLWRARKSFFQRMRERDPHSRPTKTFMASPLQGMGTLVQSLETHLRTRLGKRFVTGTPVQELPRSGNVVLAVPAHQAADLLKGVDQRTSELLQKVTYTPLISCTIFVEKSSKYPIPRAVGMMVPPKEGGTILGILFNSKAFPNRVHDSEKWESMTVMLGGSSRPEVLEWSDNKVGEVILSEVPQILGWKSDLSPESIHIFIQRWKQAVPQYDQTLVQAWESAQTGWCASPGHVIFGNYTGKVGLRGLIETVMAL